MKINLISHPPRAAYALIMVMVMSAAGLLLLTSVMNRAQTVSGLNQRNNMFQSANNAAEAAVEKAFGAMAWNFQNYGLSAVTNTAAMTMYVTNVPGASEDGYWTNFIFSDACGNSNRTYISFVTNYSGPLPSAYGGLLTAGAPIYSVISNARNLRDSKNVIGTCQEYVLFALVPLVNYAIFYNGNMEFTQCAPMTVSGAVHANGSISVGTSTSLNFYSPVTCTGNLDAPGLDGLSAYAAGSWNTYFSNNPAYKTNIATVTVSLNMTNSHFLIEIPTNGESPISSIGQQRLYNQAQMILFITNDATGVNPNPTVTMQLQASVGGAVPGNDPSKAVYTFTNAGPSNLATNLPWLTLNSSFYDRRQTSSNIITDINVGSYGQWAATNPWVQGKLPSSSQIYPTIMYVADRRVGGASQQAVVRLKNGAVIPANGTHGFTVATQNPVYMQGDYNVQQSVGGASSAATTNTANTWPAAIMTDALTILSTNWSDAYSTTAYSSSDNAYNANYTTTINAAIITGIMPSTGTSATTFSGGVHNLPRLLQDWSGVDLYINTSILMLYSSTIATNQFRNPDGWSGTVNPYYNPPNRHYNFDLNFLNPSKVPPGIPSALVPIRFAWGTPAPGVTNFVPALN